MKTKQMTLLALVLASVALASPAFSDDHHHHNNDQNQSWWDSWQDNGHDRNNRKHQHDQDNWQQQYFYDRWNDSDRDNRNFVYPPSNSGDFVGGHGKNH